MGKYWSGVSMKTMMELEMRQIERILADYNMLDSDKELIKDAYKDICYHWCNANAFACLTDEVLMQMLDEEHKAKMQKLMLKLSLGYVEQKMIDTYPWYDDESGMDEDEELDDLLDQLENDDVDD